MSFSNSGTVGTVRFLVGDDVQNAGVLPSGGNFTDEQITARLDEVGQNAYLAAAELCRSLARRWLVAPKSVTADGLSVSRADAATWLAMARDLESQASGSETTGSIALDRQDGYAIYLGTWGEDTAREGA